MKDKIYAVYLRKNSEGSFTFIDGKRYFIDRTCTELQNKEGVFLLRKTIVFLLVIQYMYGSRVR